MPIPDYQTMMRPLLEMISDGQPHDLNILHDQACDYFKLTDEERQEMIKSGQRTVIRSRVGWARTYLHKAGLLTLPLKRHVQITERGRQVLAEGPERIDTKYLKQFEEFKEFMAPKSKLANDDSDEAVEETNATPEEQLENAFESLNQTLASDLLDQIKEVTPQFFEKLVVDLMLAMGYGGSREDAGQATQYTADGGIDGVIKEDALGLDTIYLQAKRYTENTIGRPEIQKFAGALDMKRAKKGVFITTSKFSTDAHEFVSMIEKKIVLIDGEYLAELMIEYNLAVAIKQIYAVKAIDSDYFNED